MRQGSFSKKMRILIEAEAEAVAEKQEWKNALGPSRNQNFSVPENYRTQISAKVAKSGCFNPAKFAKSAKRPRSKRSGTGSKLHNMSSMWCAILDFRFLILDWVKLRKAPSICIRSIKNRQSKIKN